MRKVDPAAFATAEAAEQYARASAPRTRLALMEASYKSALRVFGAHPIARKKTPAGALFERLISPPEPFLATLTLKTANRHTRETQVIPDARRAPEGATAQARLQGRQMTPRAAHGAFSTRPELSARPRI
jgi:hypothetical protein